MRIEITKSWRQGLLSHIPIKLSVADRIATAMEKQEIVAALGAYFTAIERHQTENSLGSISILITWIPLRS